MLAYPHAATVQHGEARDAGGVTLGFPPRALAADADADAGGDEGGGEGGEGGEDGEIAAGVGGTGHAHAD